MKNFGRIFENKQQKERIGHVTKKFEKLEVWKRQIETCSTEQNMTIVDELVVLLYKKVINK